MHYSTRGMCWKKVSGLQKNQSNKVSFSFVCDGASYTAAINYTIYTHKTASGSLLRYDPYSCDQRANAVFYTYDA